MEGARSRRTSNIAAVETGSARNCPSRLNVEAGFSMSQIVGRAFSASLGDLLASGPRCFLCRLPCRILRGALVSRRSFQPCFRSSRSRPGLSLLAPLRGRRPMQRRAGQFLPLRASPHSSRSKKQSACRPPLCSVPAGAFVRLKPPPFGCQKGRTTPAPEHKNGEKPKGRDQ